jgi:iron complex transport system substrate-binding protein
MNMRIAVLAAFAFLIPQAVLAAEVTDLAGRTVAVPDKVERIVLGEGRYLPAFAILDKDDPIKRVVGMMGEYEKLDPGSYARFKSKFPKIDGVPRIGRTSADSFSLESVIALKPQVAFLGVEGHGPGSKATEIINALEAAGVTIVFIDFRRDPLANTPKTMELIGKVLGREKEAGEFLAVWRAEMDKVTSRLAEKKPKPVRTFIESRVGLSEGCCETMVRGMIADFVTKAGGVNIAGDIVPGHAGTISLEYLLTNQPEVYIGTGIGAAATKDSAPERIALGADVSPAIARETLARSLKRNGIADLDAVKNGRAFAVWHHFYNSPLNVAAVQAIAKWLHPDLFADLDPDGLLRDLHQKFQPFELEGAYWTSAR